MDAFTGILTSFGLSSSAGLNAYLPLLIVAFLSRFTDLIRLNEPFDALESWWTIGVLIVLAAIEFLADLSRARSCSRPTPTRSPTFTPYWRWSAAC
jgi:hypothetical protein